MPYKILKQRINTNFSRIIKPFKTSDSFAKWTARPDYQFSTLKAFSDCNLESATAAYHVCAAGAKLDVEIRLMQSTRHTSYCFDVFLWLKFESYSAQIESIISCYDDRLEALRAQYNGDWIIEDQDLTLSVLL